MKNLALPVEIRKNDRRPARKLPDDLPARATRRRQRLGIGHDRELGEISFAFGKCFPDRDAFGANSQPIAGAFHITACIDFAVLGSDGGSD